MKPIAAILALAMLTTAHVQTLDKAKLDQLLDRLAEKNKAIGEPDPCEGR
jgi:hypothetical protein